jgi:Zn-dependent protease with chaperone function
MTWGYSPIFGKRALMLLYSDQLAAFGIAGGVGHGIKQLFLSHPPLADRIAALEAER